MGGIPVETLPAGATLADVHLVYERKTSPLIPAITNDPMGDYCP